jgi:hypothetical protein
MVDRPWPGEKTLRVKKIQMDKASRIKNEVIPSLTPLLRTYLIFRLFFGDFL